MNQDKKRIWQPNASFSLGVLHDKCTCTCAYIALTAHDPLTHSHTHMYSFFPHLHTNSLDSTLFHLSASIISLSLSLSAQFVLKMMSGWSMVSLLTRVVLRCAGMEYGAQCVVTCGNQLMPEWCVDNWDILALVSSIYAMYCTLSCSGKLWRGLPNAFFADSSNIMLPRCTRYMVL